MKYVKGLLRAVGVLAFGAAAATLILLASPILITYWAIQAARDTIKNYDRR